MWPPPLPGGCALGRHHRKKASVHILQSQAEEITALIKSEAIPETNRDEFVRHWTEVGLAHARQHPRVAQGRVADVDRSLAPGIPPEEALSHETES